MRAVLIFFLVAAVAPVIPDSKTNSAPDYKFVVNWTMQAIIGEKMPNGFTTTQYRRSCLPTAITNALLLTVPAYIEGANVTNSAVGDKWSGVVLDGGVVTNKATGAEFHRYVVKVKERKKVKKE